MADIGAKPQVVIRVSGPIVIKPSSPNLTVKVKQS